MVQRENTTKANASDWRALQLQVQPDTKSSESEGELETKPRADLPSLLEFIWDNAMAGKRLSAWYRGSHATWYRCISNGSGVQALDDLDAGR